MLGQASGRAAGVPLSISISGNHFVNGAGGTVRLLGVNHASFEYACEQGWGYNDGHMNAADAAAVASWHATAVRVPLNEDCWLGINGQPNSSQGADPPLTTDGYRQAVEDYVAALNAAGLYAILDLHWTAPSTYVADGQRPMPDEHSVAFWSSMAMTFKNNHAVVFDAFNEPYSPAAVNDPAHPVNWDCWRNGTAAAQDCFLPVSKDGDPPDNSHLYGPVGMQLLVNTIRNTGATQPILLGGLSYANDLTGWLANEPSDPDGQLAASFHNYQGEKCGDKACWDSTIAPVAKQVPVVTGEFDQDVCRQSTFDADYMDWADRHGVSYLAWGWWVLSAQEKSDAGCSAYYLLNNYDGTPAAPNGTVLHDHLVGLATGGSTPGGRGKPPALRSFTAQVRPGAASVGFALRSSTSCNGTLTGSTVSRFEVSAVKHRLRYISLGTARFMLSAGRSKTVVLTLSKASRRLLTRNHSLRVRFTIALTHGAARSVSHRTLTLKTPR